MALPDRHRHFDGPADEPTADQPLFRPEALESQRTQWLGPVMLEPKRYHSVLILLVVAACTAVILVLVFGTYTSKVRLRGWLVPESGLARISAPQNGVIGPVLVREGQTVTKGTPLLSLSAEVRSRALGGSREEAVRQLAARKNSFVDATARHAGLSEQQKGDLERRIAILESEYAHLTKEVDYQRARVSIAQQTLERERRMRARDLISLTRLQRTEQESLDASSRLETTERARQALHRERMHLSSQLAELPLRTQLQLNEIERSISALDQDLAEAESKREIIVVAPSDGTITTIQAQSGSAAQAGAPLLTLVPLGSPLVAQMFASSRGTGFIHSGQVVHLRHRAYPFQKFGFYSGQVTNVSRAALSPSELSPQLAGLSSMFAANEPIYQVMVGLNSQTVMAYGQSMPLQPGMEVEADILVDTRRLIEWAFEPLFSITGRLAK